MAVDHSQVSVALTASIHSERSEADPEALETPLREAAPSSDDIAARAREASEFLKAFSNEGRLTILCHLATGEKSVTELERLLAARQPAVSQNLARLRLEGLVSSRREGRAIIYAIADERAARMIECIHDLFCGGATDA